MQISFLSAYSRFQICLLFFSILISILFSIYPGFKDKKKKREKKKHQITE